MPEEREEWAAYKDALGRPEELERRLQAIDAIIEERKHRAWFGRSVRTVLSWATGGVAAWLAIKAILQDLLPWIKGG